MNLFTILERCRERQTMWDRQAKELRPVNHVAHMAAQSASRDWKQLESEILASIDEEQEQMLKTLTDAPAVNGSQGEKANTD